MVHRWFPRSYRRWLLRLMLVLGVGGAGVGLAWEWEANDSVQMRAVLDLVAAQQSGMSGQRPSMETMMQECRGHCQETTTSIDRLMTTMDKAQQSNDPVQMREVLAQAQQPLAAMKDHRASCMSMMQQMQGGMGGQMQQK